MKSQDQLVNFELSKMLEKLGVKQDSLFYWVEDDRDKRAKAGVQWKNYARKILSNSVTLYSAFTISELLAKLPSKIKINFSDGYWTCSYDWSDSLLAKISTDKHFKKTIKDKSLINILAKMLGFINAYIANYK